MEAYDLIRHTVNIAGLAAVVLSMFLILAGYQVIAAGLVFGIIGGLLKSYFMAISAINAGNSVKSFLSRYFIITLIFVGCAYISIEAFFASAAGIMLVHLVFIWEQVKFAKIEDVG